MRPSLLVLVGMLLACTPSRRTEPEVSLIVLGTVQDAGSPHIGCDLECCRELFIKNDYARKVVSLGVVDRADRKSYLLDASPDLPHQLKMLKGHSGLGELPNGIFLTHAHIGHYSGLMYLGKEGKGAAGVAVFALPRMADFLSQNGPWSQLVSDSNIVLNPILPSVDQQLTDRMSITPLRVPHRDEYSETAGFLISGPNRKALYIPDIDKWQKWDQDILQWLKDVDLAFLDATFFSGTELGGRDMRLIPHPTIQESIAYFSQLPMEVRNKVYFIHLNHSNPALDPKCPEAAWIIEQGFHIAELGDVHGL